MDSKYKIECILSDVSDNEKSIIIEESGAELSELMLKKDFKSSALNVLKDKNISGELYVDITVTRDGDYYDHDEFNININSVFAECHFIN